MEEAGGIIGFQEKHRRRWYTHFYEEQGVYKELASPEDLPEGASQIIKEGHLIEKLMEGREYILRETLAPENYVGL